MEWIAENAATVIIAVFIAASVSAAVFSIIRKRKKGGCNSCNGDCSSCNKKGL